jgi:hypothetical protein
MQQEPIVVGNRNKEVHLAIWGKRRSVIVEKLPLTFGELSDGLDNLKARGDSEALPIACCETCGR